jgi:hypothetical protein
MPWRFHRSVKILPGVRLNFSKRGTGVSFGVKGFRHSVGPSGRRTTISIPGTGLSYIKQHSTRQRARQAPQPAPADYPATNTVPQSSGLSFGRLAAIGLVGLLIWGCITSSLAKLGTTTAFTTPTTLPATARPIAAAPTYTPAPVVGPPVVLTENAKRAALATEAVPTPIPFNSGGIGLTMAEWERIYGSGLPPNTNTRQYNNGTIQVWFAGLTVAAVDPDSFIIDIRRNWQSGGDAAIAAARVHALAFIPADAHLDQTRSPTNSLTEIYSSASLYARYADPRYNQLWTGRNLGAIAVNYIGPPDNISLLLISIGEQISVPIPALAPNPATGPSVRCGAVCSDGSSSGATGSGACSQHGGVARWVYCAP